MTRAVFLDRDGTINKEVNYLTRIEDLVIPEDVPPTLKRFKDLGFLNIIITNQSGIARGYLTTDALAEINSEIRRRLFGFYGQELIDAVYFSPFHPNGSIPEYKISSNCRKPGTGMIDRAVKEFDIDLSGSFLIGDSYSDILCAQNAGVRSILLLAGHGQSAYKKCIEDNIQIDFFTEKISGSIMFIERKIKSDKFDKSHS